MGKPSILVLSVLVLSLPVIATSSETVDVTCPGCSHEFKAEAWMSTNNIGGQDRDFCRHAAGGQVFLMICWTCPGCWFTGYPDAFEGEQDGERKELFTKLRKDNPLKPAAKIDPKPEHCGRIPGWIRYDLLRQVAELDDSAEPLHLATVCLRAAQSQRFRWSSLDEVSGLDGARQRLEKRVKLPAPDGPSDYDRIMRCAYQFENIAADEDAKLPAKDRVRARVLAAVLYKQRGEDRDAMRIVEFFRKDEDLDAGLRTVLKDVEARVAVETRFRALAIPHFEKGLAGLDAESESAACIRYLLGVLERLRGDADKAVAHLEAARGMKGLPEPMKEWVDDEIAKAKGARAGRAAD